MGRLLGSDQAADDAAGVLRRARPGRPGAAPSGIRCRPRTPGSGSTRSTISRATARPSPASARAATSGATSAPKPCDALGERGAARDRDADQHRGALGEAGGVHRLVPGLEAVGVEHDLRLHERRAAVDLGGELLGRRAARRGGGADEQARRRVELEAVGRAALRQARAAAATRPALSMSRISAAGESAGTGRRTAAAPPRRRCAAAPIASAASASRLRSRHVICRIGRVPAAIASAQPASALMRTRACGRSVTLSASAQERSSTWRRTPSGVRAARRHELRLVTMVLVAGEQRSPRLGVTRSPGHATVAARSAAWRA